MNVACIKSLTLFVADQDAALSFYTEKLGFVIRDDRTMTSFRWLEVAPEGAETGMVLFPSLPGKEAGRTSGVLLRVNDVAETVEALRAAGVDVTGPTQRPWGAEATFTDPDGNGFVLTEN